MKKIWVYLLGVLTGVSVTVIIGVAMNEMNCFIFRLFASRVI